LVQIAELVNTVVTILTILLFARSILSFVIRDPSNPIMRFLYDVTEPILAPIRRRMPTMGGFDLSMLVAFFGIQIIGQLVVRMLLGGGL
jgi:YggT family protein